ncbi:MAG TPA: hypothetical protein ENO24_06360, partial [Chloroflexi bacterium]|nr:hypothetical protein [Chloroflexota bacterium]
MNTPADSALQAATMRLCVIRPYLATAVLSMLPVEAPGLGTLAVDHRWRVYYDPDVISRWPMQELAAALYHEVSHLLRDHHGRCSPVYDKLLW